MKVFIDLGSYTGDTILKAMRVYPDFDRYIGFEPVPELYQKSKDMFEKDSRVVLHQLAISPNPKKSIKFFTSYRKEGVITSGSTMIKSKTTGQINADRFFYAESIDIAEYIKDNLSKEDHIVLKVDVEGMEYEVFDNLIETGIISYVNKIYCDWHYKKMGSNREKYKRRHKKIVKKLTKLGYKINGSKEDSF